MIKDLREALGESLRDGDQFVVRAVLTRENGETQVFELPPVKSAMILAMQGPDVYALSLMREHELPRYVKYSARSMAKAVMMATRQMLERGEDPEILIRAIVQAQGESD